MSEAPFYQIDVNEHLVDTMHISLEAEAVYTRIKLFLWKSGGEMRFDDKKIAMMCRITQARFLKIWEEISSMFSLCDGMIFDEKMQEKLQKISEKSQKNSRNGSLGGKAKSLRNNNTGLANASETLEYARAFKPESELELELEEKNTKKEKSSNEYTEEFEQFQNLYPKTHCSKAEAFKAWKSAIKKAPPDKIIDGVHKYIASLEPGTTWIKHASTWLNKEGWTIEYQPYARKPQSGKGMPYVHQSTGAGRINLVTKPSAQYPGREGDIGSITH